MDEPNVFVLAAFSAATGGVASVVTSLLVERVKHFWNKKTQHEAYVGRVQFDLEMKAYDVIWQQCVILHDSAIRTTRIYGIKKSNSEELDNHWKALEAERDSLTNIIKMNHPYSHDSVFGAVDRYDEQACKLMKSFKPYIQGSEEEDLETNRLFRDFSNQKNAVAKAIRGRVKNIKIAD